MAITDMSDNANKMGSDMASIQNAYQGFAKGTYNMLDNLKLGYGGTKSEMERLLKDAEKISGIKYDISSYADVVQAIHVMQESMGIAGTTALEAEKTISGSIGSLKAAFQNMVVGFGNSQADMKKLCGDVVKAFSNVLTNITPIIKNIVEALPIALEAMIPVINDLLPTLLSTVGDLFEQILNMLFSVLPELIPVAVDAVMTIVDALIGNLPLLVSAALQLVTTLVNGIGTALPDLIPAAVEAVSDNRSRVDRQHRSCYRRGAPASRGLGERYSGRNPCVNRRAAEADHKPCKQAPVGNSADHSERVSRCSSL